MLKNAWLYPAIPAVSFFLILFFGKRMPKKGAEIGIAAVGASFVLACIAAVEWIDRVESATGKHEGLAAFGKGMLASGAHHEVIKPVVHSIVWWQNGAVDF